MKKLSLILCIILIITLLAACKLPDVKPIILGDSVTLNQFWNGILKDEDAVVYDQTHNPERFARTGYEDAVSCVAVKDYNVYMMYDFTDTSATSDYVLQMLESWNKNKVEIDCIPTASGIYYIMKGAADNCNVCYVSNNIMILGLGNHQDEQEIRDTIQDVIRSEDSEYDTSRIQTLPLVQRTVSK